MPGKTIEEVQIAIFAKAPIAGYAKTRLIPLLGPEGAASLQALLIGRIANTALASSLRPVSLWCAPDRTHGLFASIGRERAIETYTQVGGDLGARMLHAFETLTQRSFVILVGADCPAITAAHFERCAKALRGGANAVFITAEDGGYVLVGLRKPVPQIFEDVPWGTGEVMNTTRDRLRKLGMRVSEVEELWDIDTPADYRRAESTGFLDGII